MGKNICFLVIIVTLILVLSFPVLAQNFKIGFVTDIGGLDDNSVNDQIRAGLLNNNQNLELTTKIKEVNLMSNYLASLNELAEEGFNLIWAAGYTMQEAVEEAAQMNPERQFALLDATVNLENVLSIQFADQESAYLAGITAAIYSKTGVIAFIGGRKTDKVLAYQQGFNAGAKVYRSDIKVINKYIDSFNFSLQTADICQEVKNDGADIIFHAAGSNSQAIINFALKNKIYLIAADPAEIELAPQNTLTSLRQNITYVVEQENNNLVTGKYRSGIKKYGLAENGVGLDQKQLAKFLTETEQQTIDQYRAEISNDEISIFAE
jgi:basic membrane protein A